MENDAEFWRMVAAELEDYSIGECRLQWAWNQYCDENDILEQQILINDRDWFVATFGGMDAGDVYTELTCSDYDINDNYAREDRYGEIISNNDRKTLICHEEYAELTKWAREKANKLSGESNG